MPQDPIFSISQRAKQGSFPLYSLHLDLIRGLAALLVLVGHLRVVLTGHSGTASGFQTPGFLKHPENTTGLGHAAVVVFFVLSGYLVGGAAVRDLKKRRFSWLSYALKRIVRLWTVLIPTLLLGAFFDLLSRHYFPSSQVVSSGQFGPLVFQGHDFLQFARYSAFLQSIERLHIPRFGSNAALWSLSNEFFYYLLFPLIAILCIGRQFTKSQRILVGIVAAFLLWFLGPLITNYFPLWLCGVAVYMLPSRIPARLQNLANVVLAIQFCTVLYIMRSDSLDPFLADIWIAISFTALLYGLLHQVQSTSSVVYARLAHIMSLPSYSLYANHIPPSILIAAILETTGHRLFIHTGVTFALVFLAVLGYNGLFYFAFERNTDRIRSFVQARFAPRKSAAEAA